MLKTVLNIEGIGGRIPYYKFVECQLSLPEMEGFKKDALMLVVEEVCAHSVGSLTH